MLSTVFAIAAMPQEDQKTEEEVTKPIENKELKEKKVIDEETPIQETQSHDEMTRLIKQDWDQLLKIFESEDIKVDLLKKQVELTGVIIRDAKSTQYPIEYVVVSEGGSSHEAMLLVKATPSHLNAAMLAIGVTPGKTVTFKKKDPPPPQEEIDKGITSPYDVIPPAGDKVYIYVKYDGWEEKPVRFLEDLLMDLRTGKPLMRKGWIYVGSRFAEVLMGRERVVKYMADMERNIVACYLTGLGNAIFDINDVDGINDTYFDVYPSAIPPMGSKVQIIFTLEPL